MLKFGFTIYLFQLCIFVWSRGNKLLFILLYVDDLLIIGNCLAIVQKFKTHLYSYFEMKDLDFPHKFVGLELKMIEKTLFLLQKTTISKLLE